MKNNTFRNAVYQTQTGLTKRPGAGRFYNKNKAEYMLNSFLHALGLGAISLEFKEGRTWVWLKKYWFYAAFSLLVILILFRKLPGLRGSGSQANETASIAPIGGQKPTSDESAYSFAPASLPSGKTTLSTKNNTSEGKRVPDSKVYEYLRRFESVAKKETKKFGIPTSIIFGIALSRGAAGLTDIAQTGNNHFAITCFDNILTEGVIGQNTDNGVCYTYYENSWASFRANSLLLTSGKYEYIKGLAGRNPDKWIAEIAKLGYCGDSKAAESIRNNIVQYNLVKYDN